MPSHNRIRRNVLWEKNPNCFWCGKITVRPPRKAEAIPEMNWATLDHLDTKLHKTRKLRDDNIRRTVLACWLCNNIRGLLTEKSLKSISLHIIEVDGVWKYKCE